MEGSRTLLYYKCTIIYTVHHSNNELNVKGFLLQLCFCVTYFSTFHISITFLMLWWNCKTKMTQLVTSDVVYFVPYDQTKRLNRRTDTLACTKTKNI